MHNEFLDAFKAEFPSDIICLTEDVEDTASSSSTSANPAKEILAVDYSSKDFIVWKEIVRKE